MKESANTFNIVFNIENLDVTAVLTIGGGSLITLIALAWRYHRELGGCLSRLRERLRAAWIAIRARVTRGSTGNPERVNPWAEARKDPDFGFQDSHASGAAGGEFDPLSQGPSRAPIRASSVRINLPPIENKDGARR